MRTTAIIGRTSGKRIATALALLESVEKRENFAICTKEDILLYKFESVKHRAINDGKNYDIIVIDEGE